MQYVHFFHTFHSVHVPALCPLWSSDGVMVQCSPDQDEAIFTEDKYMNANVQMQKIKT